MRKELEEILDKTQKQRKEMDERAFVNQKRVLEAFKNNKIALRHFAGTSGYGYDDAGRDAFNNVVAEIFGAEKAVCGPLIASGTHAITVALFGVLRPGDEVLSAVGKPYDTLEEVIDGKNNGSLADFGVKFHYIDLVGDDFDYDAIREFLQSRKVKMLYLQRSRGYAWRQALSIQQLKKVCSLCKEVSPQTVIFCDNCYGEFADVYEPTHAGVDFCAGSFIKNIGGGVAPTGGYVVGRGDLVDLAAGRLTAPSIGAEVGSYTAGYRLFYQGLFLAPHVTCQALKTALIFSQALSDRGYEVSPKPDGQFGDVVCSIKLGSEEKMRRFCKAIQSVSPVDGFVTPEPWYQPGYADKVIMAAGCFVQGASIELSCDGPIRPPYTVYLQGGLTLEHGLYALEKVLDGLE